MTTWDHLRATTSRPLLSRLVSQSQLVRDTTITTSHIRTAHYAVFRVDTATKESYIARLGCASPQRFAPNNTGLLGCATSIDHDQSYEWDMGVHLDTHGAQIIRPLSYQRLPQGIDILWLPYVDSLVDTLATTQAWADLLLSFRKVPRLDEIPVFSNYQKTKQRITTLHDAAPLLDEYEAAMARLFDVATRWGVVHGDLHADNIVVTPSGIRAYDLDTVSWAPAVWDITHLALRHGTGANQGYDPTQLYELLGFTRAEYYAALELRQIAARVARLAITAT